MNDSVTTTPNPAAWRVGLAAVDVTPEAPIRMAGYGARTALSVGVHDRLRAKALAIAAADGEPALLITLDLIGVDAEFAAILFAAIRARTGIPRERIIINASHTHGGPVFGSRYPRSYSLEGVELRTVEHYSAVLADRIAAVAAAAVQTMTPAGVDWEINTGAVNVAMNRRRFTQNGVQNAPYPRGYVDRSVPILRVRQPKGQLRAMVVGYSCHNTTLMGDNLLITADYAGYAQRYVEARHDGVQVMFMQGCGADANPYPRGSFALAEQHGEALGREVCRVLTEGRFEALEPPLQVVFGIVDLPFEPPPTPAELAETRRRGGAAAQRAAEYQALLDAGKPAPACYTTPLALWRFGQGLTLVRLSAEVVGDYIPLMERAIGPINLWVAGYCDDYFGYVPSAKVKDEGGYEANSFIAGHGRLTRDAQTAILRKVRELAAQVGRPIPQ